MKLSIQCILAVALIGTSLAAAERGRRRDLDLTFGERGVTVRAERPGSRMAWLAMIVERRDYHDVVRIIRGFGPATPDSTFTIARDAAKESRAVWAVADVDGAMTIQRFSPGTRTSPHPISVDALAGDAQVTVRSAAIELLYVRPRAGAWTFHAADGGGRDADAMQNGSITVPLASLKPLEGSGQAPASVEPGDLILMIDPRLMRASTVEVTR